MASQDLYSLYMRVGIDGDEKVLLDPSIMDSSLKTSVTFEGITSDGGIIIYGLQHGGEDEIEVHFLDVATGETMSDYLERGRYFGVAVNADKSGYYYSHYTEEGARIYYHRFGTDNANDKYIFGEQYGSDKLLIMSLSDDGKYLIVTVYYGSSGVQNEIWVKDVINDEPIIAVVDTIEANFYGSVANERIFMRTNWNAPNWRVVAADLKPGTTPDMWTEIVPESDSDILEDVNLTGDKILTSALHNVNSKLTLYEYDGTIVDEVELPTIGASDKIQATVNSDKFIYDFASFHFPKSYYEYDLTTGKSTLWYQHSVEGDPMQLEINQVWFTSKDGTRVPMFLINQKGIELDGSHPTHIYSYGGFNQSQKPYFSNFAMFWCSRGGVYAVAGLRGGGEFGQEWHKAGMFEQKQNTFDDLIAASEWLIDNKYTSPEKLSIGGGSNGGLTVGAVMLQRPELYQAVICSYPLLDMLRYHLLLVGSFWVTEYGSADDSAQFEYIRAYSPYQNVVNDGDYPAVLFTTGDNDTRVAPAHARKMTAMMQAATGSDNPILLHYDTLAGHSGGDPVSRQVETYAVYYGFLANQLGLELEN
jgi:prolyl oligopeptidase